MDTAWVSPGNGLGSTQLRKSSLVKHVSQPNQTDSNAVGDNPSLSHRDWWSNPAPFQEEAVAIDDSKSSLSDHSSIVPPEMAHTSPGRHERRDTMGSIIQHFVPESVTRTFTKDSVSRQARRGTVWSMYNKAQNQEAKLIRKRGIQVLFELSIYVLLVSFVYFVLVGRPLWKGSVWWLYWVMKHKFVFRGGVWISIGIAFAYAFAPLLIFFEKDFAPEQHGTAVSGISQSKSSDTALLIPCHKSAGLLPATLEAALRTFPPLHIFVLANGNSAEPIDDTETVCKTYGVNHIWSPIGSKIVAQFVGCYAARNFSNVLLIDDDCVLPDAFPVVTDRLVGNVKCIGYTIKSVGPQRSKGTLCQQAQDFEYKISGLQRDFAGRIGSATFPHGAIALWNRELLLKSFQEHPGYSVSEDWFFGHVARRLGSRITMCSQVFVETETPSAVFTSSGSRGGFGEMTVFKQRFKRWNFFLVSSVYYNTSYLLVSWKLGFRELSTKIFVFKEIYETVFCLLAPVLLPIAFIVQPRFTGILLAATTAMYIVHTSIFNEIHLRRKNERVGSIAVYVYYLPYKMLLTAIDVASCYWSIFKYAHYFARRHLKVTEDAKAVEIVLRLEDGRGPVDGSINTSGRRLTVHTIGTESVSEVSDEGSQDVLARIKTEGIAAVDYAMISLESPKE